MHPRHRFVITTLFILLFAVTLPLVLLWTAGYKLNWSKKRVQKTGIVHIESEPRGATVFINDEQQSRLTPASYTRLLPEDYRVRVQKDGYFPWSKTLEVTSSQTTFASGVVLYRDALPNLNAEKNIESAVWDRRGKRVAYVASDDDRKEVGVLTIGGKDALLARFPLDGKQTHSLDWSPDDDKVLLTSRDDLGRIDAQVHVLPTVLTPEGASTHVATDSRAAHWASDGSVIVVSDTGAYSVDARTGSSSPWLVSKNIIDADAMQRTGYVLRTVAGATPESQRTLLERVGSGPATTIAELPTGRYRFLRGNDSTLLIAEERRNRITVVDRASGALSTYDGTGYAWEPNGERLLLWNDFEISIVDPRDGSRELVTRIAAAITQCDWSPFGDGVLYATPSGISYVELDPRDQRNALDLARFSPSGLFGIDRDANVLRFTGTIGNQRGIFERGL